MRTMVSLISATLTQRRDYYQGSEPQMEKLSLKHTPKSDHKTTAEMELERLERKLRTVQLALEILTGASATLPDPDPDVGVGDNEDEGE
jgi:hypothetical protein